MYVRTSFRGAKIMQNWKNRVCFCNFYKFGKGHEGKVSKKQAKTCN